MIKYQLNKPLLTQTLEKNEYPAQKTKKIRTILKMKVEIDCRWADTLS
jgi:hypothetical protein